jgi:hypothetical protein
MLLSLQLDVDWQQGYVAPSLRIILETDIMGHARPEHVLDTSFQHARASLVFIDLYLYSAQPAQRCGKQLVQG